MKAVLRTNPTESAWQALLPRICELHGQQGWSVEDTRTLIKNETGYYPSLAKYRKRVERTLKSFERLPVQVLDAMWIITRYNRGRQADTGFVLRWNGLVMRSSQVPPVASSSCTQGRPIISLQRAHRILGMVGVYALATWTACQPASESVCKQAGSSSLLAQQSWQLGRTTFHGCSPPKQAGHDFESDLCLISQAMISELEPILLPQPSRTHHLRRMVVESAAMYLKHPDPSIAVQAESTARLEELLTREPPNEYVLTFMHWASVRHALGPEANGFERYLAACCSILNQSRNLPNDLAAPFNFLYAVLRQDLIATELQSSLMRRARESTARQYGPTHPHVLVIDFYRGWHLSSEPLNVGAAITILTECLAGLEERVGSQALITVNCLAALGKCYASQGHLALAKAMFEKALDRSRDCPSFGKLQGFQLGIVEGLAATEKLLGCG